MKRFLTFFVFLILLATPTFAKIGYVSDTLIITVRDHPQMNAKILATVKTAAQLEILETFKEYLRVKTSKGVEGYIRRQYITDETPKIQQIKLLGEENSQLKKQLSSLTEKLDSIQGKAQTLSRAEKELAKLKTDYQTLRKNSAGVLQVTRERNELQQENNDLTSHIQKLKEENAVYLRTGLIKWFFAGAGVLLLGWIMGKISRKKKRGYL